MTATVLLRAYSGSSGSPTLTDVTALNTRLNTSDTHAAAGSATPVQIPTSGTNYSYWVALRPDATVTPVGTISNGRWYTDGANSSPSGVTYKCQEATAYVQATGTAGVTGLQLNTTNYSTLTGAPVDLFSFTSSAPKSIAGSITNPSTGPFGSWFVIQGEVASTTATSGPVTVETLSYVFDET
jgi:hypothetical protein